MDGHEFSQRSGVTSESNKSNRTTMRPRFTYFIGIYICILNVIHFLMISGNFRDFSLMLTDGRRDPRTYAQILLQRCKDASKKGGQMYIQMDGRMYIRHTYTISPYCTGLASPLVPSGLAAQKSTEYGSVRGHQIQRIWYIPYRDHQC